MQQTSPPLDHHAECEISDAVMDKLEVLTRYQREYWECSIMLFLETWLTVLIITDRWCNSEHIIIELLAVSIRSSYLLREFLCVIAIVVYPPPFANADMVCDIHK